MRTIYISICLIISMHFSLKAQPIKEIQIGVLYNKFTWDVTNPISPSNSTIYKYNRLSVVPTFRFLYTFQLKRIDKISLTTFVGYGAFGGKSKSDSTKFKEKYTSHNLELGILPSYQIMKNTTVGVGLKINYSPITLYSYYGTIYQSDNFPRKWFTENVSENYTNLSGNFGLNIKHSYQRFSISLEGWFGLTNLANNNSNIYDSKIKENNFRLLFGYRLSNERKTD